MKVGLIPINVGIRSIEQMVAMAQTAEAAGVESVWTFEHSIVPVEYQSAYPYSDSGKMGAAAETPFVDPLIALTAVSQHTTTIKLGTGVNILPQSNPLLMAKQVASLDLLSKGRVLLGLGIGWLQEEFVANGAPFERRGARFDDYVQGMKKIWGGEVVEHQSDFLNWSNFKSYPTPIQQPFPVIIGGTKGKVFERIAKYGEGWYAPIGDPAELAPMLAQLKSTCEQCGRDYQDIEITASWANTGVDVLRQLEDLGVARVVTPVPTLGGDNALDGIKKLGDQVLSKL